jgi:hypothetical protein
VQQAKDIRRSVDYIQTRSDLDHEKLAFYGVSTGVGFGPKVIAADSRFKTAILQGGGLPASESDMALPGGSLGTKLAEEVYARAAIGGYPEAEISAHSERDLVTWPPSGFPTELLASEVRLGDR